MIPLAGADVDSIRIAFDEASLTTLKIVIAAILFGVALDTRPGDFAAAVRRPGAIAVAIAAQFLTGLGRSSVRLVASMTNDHPRQAKVR